MKLGQMISLDAGDVLPAELTAILARLRDAAHVMPPAQLNQVLVAEWGPDWRRHLAAFDATPIAAASIGQVHRAVLPDGRKLAIKVQYPGIAASIDADVDNVATLLRMSGLLPAQLDIAPLLAEAKRQLHEEADYRREAAQMRRYGELLAGDPAFVMPQSVEALCGDRILAMDFIPGSPIETLEQAPPETRDAAMQYSVWCCANCSLSAICRPIPISQTFAGRPITGGSCCSISGRRGRFRLPRSKPTAR